MILQGRHFKYIRDSEVSILNNLYIARYSIMINLPHDSSLYVHVFIPGVPIYNNPKQALRATPKPRTYQIHHSTMQLFPCEMLFFY